MNSVKTCKLCGDTFRTKHPDTITVCGKKHTVICVICGTEFIASEYSDTKTCSRSCRGKYVVKSGIQNNINKARMQDPSKFDNFVEFKSDPAKYILDNFGTSRPNTYTLSKNIGIDIAIVCNYVNKVNAQKSCHIL